MSRRGTNPPAKDDIPGRGERLLVPSGCDLIAGIDEAGRGPLAGPVTAAAVILPSGFSHTGIRDSKACSPRERERLYRVIVDAALAWAVGEASPEEIDRDNIRQATFSAMRRALDGLSVRPDFVLVDGWDIPGIDLPQRSLFRGEQQSQAIAAASILAKVTRDRKMVEYDAVFPGYGFKRHKGYGTREHITAIRRLGPLSIHRLTFSRVREYVSPDGTGR